MRRKPGLGLNKDDEKCISDFVEQEKEVVKSLAKRLRLYFREYCDNSSLHGIKYVGEKGRSAAERLWWIIIFFSSIAGCGYLIMKTYNKWQMSPVIVSFAQSPTPVWQVPFPAVTVCSENKIRQTIFNISDAYRTLHPSNNYTSEIPEEQIKKRMEDISLICGRGFYKGGNKTADQSSIDFIIQAAPRFETTLSVCRWMNKKRPGCTKLFSPILTEEGLCFTFNMLDSSELFEKDHQHDEYLKHNMSSSWTLDEGYPKEADLNVYPRRGLGSGVTAGLTIMLRANKQDLDYICRGPVQGFKILLHNPAEIPRVSQKYFRAPLNQEVTVAVTPDMMTTSEGLKYYSSRTRHCYFPHERGLRFYKVYSQQNCEVECLTNFTLNKCGCVSYYMPRDPSTPICGSGSLKCVKKAAGELLLREVGLEMSLEDKEKTVPHIDPNPDHQCDCLPGCTSLTYYAETSQAEFDWKKVFEELQEDVNEFSGLMMTKVSIFFKDTQFITSRRSELYGPTDFIANCGGLLGLFMGFSFLSLIEIIYFVTLRLWCNIKMRRKKQCTSSKNHA